MAVASATRARRSALRARIRSTLALATSTSARATSDFGRVPTSKKPRAERRFSSARSTACWFTWIRRTAKLMLVNDSFTVCVTSWRCSSVSSRAKSASLRAASVDAKFFPKSNRICDSDTRATVVVDHVVMVRAFCVVMSGDTPPATFWSRATVQLPVICGSSGASA